MVFFYHATYIILYNMETIHFFIFSTMFLKDLLMIAAVNPNI